MAWTDSAKARLSGWYNLLSALGDVSLDRVVNHVFSTAPRVPPLMAEQLYYGDAFAAVIVDALPRDGLREAFEVRVEGEPEESSKANGELERLNVQSKFLEAAIWGRDMGLAAVIMVCDDGQEMSEPLRLAALQEVRYLEVATARSLTTETRYGDREDKTQGGRVVDMATGRDRNDPMTLRAQRLHGRPETYRWTQPNGRTTVVHETRMILFGGDLTTAEERIANNDRDRSVLDRVYPVLQQVNHTWQSVVANVDVSAQAVMAIKGFISGIESGQKDVIAERLALVQQARGTRILPIDSEERFDYSERSLTGLTDVANENWKVLAQAFRGPVTRLMGMSPGGLNATGESDADNWDDQVRNWQTAECMPRAKELLAAVFAAKQGPFKGVAPKSWTIHFPSLDQPSALEVAQEKAAQAETDAKEVAMGAITPAEVAASRHRVDGWSAETRLNLDARKKAEAQSQPVAALNGAQVTAVLEVMTKAAAGEIPVDAAAQVLAAATGRPLDEAMAMLGSIASGGFVPASVQAAEAEKQRQAEEAAVQGAQKQQEGADTDAFAKELQAARAARAAQKAAA